MATPLSHFRSKATDRLGNQIFWNRADIDGAPFRGTPPNHLTAEEFEQATYKTWEPHARFFDVTKPEELEEYLEVLEGAFNGPWYKIICHERFWRGSTKHYVEWLEPYLEDGTAPKKRRRRGGTRDGVPERAG